MSNSMGRFVSIGLAAAACSMSLGGCVIVDDFSASKAVYEGNQLQDQRRLKDATANFERAAELARDTRVETKARRALAGNLAKRGQNSAALLQQEKLVVLGDRDALKQIGDAISKRGYRPSDPAALASALELSAKGGSVTASVALGDLLRQANVPSGAIRQQDPQFWYASAAEKGSTAARRRLVDIAATKGDEKTVSQLASLDTGKPATDTYKRLAKSFDAGTDGFPRDIRKADRYWQLAGGRPAPKIKKAKAEPKPKDEIKVAIKALPKAKSQAERKQIIAFLDNAANRGDARAAYALARYFTPKGARPGAQALKYYSIAAANGEKKAVDEVVSGTVLPNAGNELSSSMVSSLEKAAAKGNAEAAFGLAQMYLNGTAVTADTTKSTKWLRRAAELGSAEAQFRLGVMLAQKEDTKIAAEGKDWLNRAARNGNKSAKAYLQQLTSG